MRALLVESILRVMAAIDLLGSACVGGTYLGQVGRVGQVGQGGSTYSDKSDGPSY